MTERANKPLLEVKNLTVRYRDAVEPVVKDLSFTLEEGEILCLHGPSGKGKSTVVWALTEMLEEYHAVASGEIRLKDKCLIYEEKQMLLNEKPKRWIGKKAKELRPRVFDWKEIALVPQSSMTAFNPVYTIRQTMLETMYACGCEGDLAEKEERLREICRRVHLDPAVLSLYPHELSGGMKQRAAIGLAILFHPSLLILDEATTGLDLLIQAQVLGTILELREKQNMTILFISHDRELAKNFCDRQIEL